MVNFVKQQEPHICQACKRSIEIMARFCPYCGALLAGKQDQPTAEEVVLSSGKHLRVSNDSLNLQELQDLVASGISWWKQHLQQTEGVAREQAAEAIKNLSRVLDSLSQQIEQGRRTVRITTRLPSTRIYSVGCPVCGHGNRSQARFCKQCGALLVSSDKNKSGADMAKAPHFRITTDSQSDVGKVRTNNEDTCYTDSLVTPSGLSVTILLVADGMGGAKAGEEASRIASETIQYEIHHRLLGSQPTDHGAWQDILRESMQIANHRIYQQSQTHKEQQGMGTTLTVALIAENYVHLGHVGDSRAYLFNAEGMTAEGDTMMQLTADHTLVARLVDIGQLTLEEARLLPQRNMLYRALGTEPKVDVDTESHHLTNGDMLLLCSDGLNAHVEDAELPRIVLEAATPQAACNQLVALTNKRGGQDNISVVVARVERV